ncbi:hypothetical protein NFI96_023178, partial [Prochilodus magdalenae]
MESYNMQALNATSLTTKIKQVVLCLAMRVALQCMELDLVGFFGGTLFRMALFRRGYSIAKPHFKTAARNIVRDIVSHEATRVMRSNQDGSGVMVMARKSVRRPPGKRRGRPARKTKRETKQPGHGDDYADLNNTLSDLRLKSTKPDGSDTDDGAAVGLINYTGATTFSHVDVSVGDGLISQSSSTYPYRSIIDRLV